MMTATENGQLGERFAANFLRKKGYAILAANFKTRFGEIDLIVQKDNILAFVEVKTRSEGSLFSPAEAVDYKKQNRIIKAAIEYITTYGYTLQPRFDVIEVFVAGDPPVLKTVNHLESAFDMSKIKDIYI